MVVGWITGIIERLAVTAGDAGLGRAPGECVAAAVPQAVSTAASSAASRANPAADRVELDDICWSLVRRVA